jgi:hypothetical protein
MIRVRSRRNAIRKLPGEKISSRDDAVGQSWLSVPLAMLSLGTISISPTRRSGASSDCVTHGHGGQWQYRFQAAQFRIKSHRTRNRDRISFGNAPGDGDVLLSGLTVEDKKTSLIRIAA